MNRLYKIRFFKMIETMLTFIFIWVCLGIVYMTINCIDEDYNPTLIGIILMLPLIVLGIITSLPFVITQK